MNFPGTKKIISQIPDSSSVTKDKNCAHLSFGEVLLVCLAKAVKAVASLSNFAVWGQCFGTCPKKDKTKKNSTTTTSNNNNKTIKNNGTKSTPQKLQANHQSSSHLLQVMEGHLIVSLGLVMMAGLWNSRWHHLFWEGRLPNLWEQ